MQASLLREPIAVYVPCMSRNEYGEQVQSYEFLFSTRAQVVHAYGSKTEENSEIYTAYRKRFIVRIYHKLNEKMHIRYRGQYYRITSIEENPQSQSIIATTELVNE